jgi:hypothetical protein
MPPKKKAKKAAKFGGYKISFSGRKETVEQVFGKKALAPSEMTKALWKYVKAKRLAGKGK